MAEIVREELFGGERMRRIFDAGLNGIWLVNPDLCNLEDLIDSRPGVIVRVQDIHNSIKFLPNEEAGMLLGCIASWLCDDEVSNCSSKTDASGAASG